VPDAAKARPAATTAASDFIVSSPNILLKASFEVSVLAAFG